MLENTAVRFALIIGVAVAAHLAAVAVRSATRRLFASRVRSETKVLTVTSFATSVIVFAVYFAAVGFLLSELGISLTTYLASASVIGLAVSFGSQGVVQDVIMGLTVVVTDVLDVGDMVDIGGQVGIVERVGMRFTVLVNFAGAHVFVPNRAITNVVTYPSGYVRGYLDVRLPRDAQRHDEAERRIARIAHAAFEQYTGVLLVDPTVEGRRATDDGVVLRTKFRLWPGQGALLEGPIRAACIHAMKPLDDAYADWMVTVHYRSEPADGSTRPPLPRPAALLRRARRSGPARDSDPTRGAT